jgi:hypothetical protein
LAFHSARIHGGTAAGAALRSCAAAGKLKIKLRQIFRRWPIGTAKERITHRHLSSSTICAAAILVAWREHNVENLSLNLANATALDIEAAASAGEGERLELLDGIAIQMRGLMAAGQIQEATVFIPLLCHLAAPVIALPDLAYLC